MSNIVKEKGKGKGKEGERRKSASIVKKRPNNPKEWRGE